MPREDFGMVIAVIDYSGSGLGPKAFLRGGIMKWMDVLVKPFKWLGGYVAMVLAGLVAVLYYIVAVPVISVVQMARFLFGGSLGRSIRNASDSDRLYYSPNHLRIARDETTVTAGPDELLLRLTGGADAIEAPKQGTMVKRGDALFQMRFDHKDCVLTSPVQGRVIEVNRLVLEHPEVLATMNPVYLWVVRLQPDNFARDVADVVPASAFDRLREDFMARLMDFFAPDVSIARADGGAIVKGLARTISDEDWKRLKSVLSLG